MDLLSLLIILVSFLFLADFHCGSLDFYEVVNEQQTPHLFIILDLPNDLNLNGHLQVVPDILAVSM
jgi:hypothetical protein